MPHPLTAQLAAEMFSADGSPATDAAGRPITIDRYRAWAEAALDGLGTLAAGTPQWGSLQAVLDDMAAQANAERQPEPEQSDPGLVARLQRAL